MKNFYHHKIIVITGGSSGIGFALATQFILQDAHVFIIARDEKKMTIAKSILQKFNKENSIIETFAADISIPKEITDVINTIGTKHKKIDVLINCAGITSHGRFTDQSAEDFKNNININYIGAVNASKAAWPYLKSAGGQLSFVSSVAGYIGLIGYSSYAPTKFALAGLAECLRYEAKDDGISVSIIYPPDTDTAMLEFEKKHTLAECLALSKNIKVKSPEEVARIYINGLQNNKFEIYCDTQSKLIRWFKNNLPDLFFYFTNKVIKKARKSARL